VILSQPLYHFPVQESINPQEVNDPFVVNRVKSTFARGAGFINYIKAMDPGLVYDYEANAYASLLLGQKNVKEVRRVYQLKDMAREVIKAWDFNYPSIMVVIPRGSSNYTLRVSRTLKNVNTSHYDCEGKVEEANALGVKIDLELTKLHFKSLYSKQQFTLTFRVDTKVWKYPSSSVTSLAWTNKTHCVKSIIVIVQEEDINNE